ncbi:MAG: YCF48-related protein [Bacteroidota bacterium]
MRFALPQRRKGAEKNLFEFIFSQCTTSCGLLICLLSTAYCLLISSCQKKQEWQWSELKQLSSYQISDLQRVNDSTINGVGGDRYFHGEFYFSNDNGATWNEKEIFDKQLYAVSFLNSDTFFSCGLDGKLLQSFNAGTDWNVIQNYTWLPMRNVIDVNDSVIISCGGTGFKRGVITTSFDNGASWQTDTLPSEMRGLCATDNQTVYSCGYGKILKSTDAGATWQQQNADGDFFISIAFANHEHGIAIGLEGTILLTDDGGANWKKIRNGNSLTNQSWNFRRIIFRDINRAYIIGDKGIFLFTNDGGTRWIKIKNTTDSNLTSIVLTNNGGIIGSDDGKLFQFLEN